MTYAQALKILSNREKYSPEQIREAKQLAKDVNDLVKCPQCKDNLINMRALKRGSVCLQCTRWNSYYGKPNTEMEPG